MKVLMFGWELPPYNAGGLGVACAGIARALMRRGVEITFVLPKYISGIRRHSALIFADEYVAPLSDCDCLWAESFAYRSGTTVLCREASLKGGPHHLTMRHRSHMLSDEVRWYAHAADRIARNVPHDIIHAHDWLTFPAAIAAKKASGKPLVVHMHATEFDRTANGNINDEVYAIERLGMHAADRVVAVSNFTKGLLVRHYGVPADKITVVHNGIDEDDMARPVQAHQVLESLKRAGNKVVLFVGRITIQKGPDYFLSVAHRVLRYEPKTYFIMAGSGDMERQIIDGAAWLNIGERFLFAGFARGEDLGALYDAADLVVMPSVSEPFGIVPLEAAAHKTPVLVSKQSGVSEVLRHALKVDFWDVDEMANQIVAALRHGALRDVLQAEGAREVQRITWQRAAEQLVNEYHAVLSYIHKPFSVNA
jgi:glycogen synthase